MGYNGFLPNSIHNSIIVNNHEQATVHSEQNAIADAARRGVSIENSIIYITHYPCLICARLLIAAGIKEIKYIENYKNGEIKVLFNLLYIKPHASICNHNKYSS